MILLVLVVLVHALFLVSSTAVGTGSASSAERLPIIFVYTVVPAVCNKGLPEYIRISLEQALYTQPDCDVIMASNYADCLVIAKTVSEMHGLIQIDTTKIESPATKLFANKSASVFASDYSNELWLTSALRFFILEDVMRTRNYSEILHVEADNMLYGRISSIVPVFRKYYPLAATPLTANMAMVTASVFWVSSLEMMVHFNTYMMDLILNHNAIYDKFLIWLRRYACCKKGGINPDAQGQGIKPFAINEMSMLANYHRLHPMVFKFFPVAPVSAYSVRRPFCNVSTFAPGGPMVGFPTGHGIWDANSWGQYIGGTSRKNGRDKGFIDSSHIGGQAIILGGCKVLMMCGNQTVAPYGGVDSAGNSVVSGGGSSGSNDSSSGSTSSSGGATSKYTGCYTAPFVQCQDIPHFTPLWNLHVHSKHTPDYRSVACKCPVLV